MSDLTPRTAAGRSLAAFLRGLLPDAERHAAPVDRDLTFTVVEGHNHTTDGLPTFPVFRDACPQGCDGPLAPTEQVEVTPGRFVPRPRLTIADPLREAYALAAVQGRLPAAAPVDRDGLREALDVAWAEAEAALPLTGWVDPVDGRWVVPPGTWSIDIRRAESGDGYFEPAVEGFWATAKVDASPRPFAIRGDLGTTPADALHSLAAAIKENQP